MQALDHWAKVARASIQASGEPRLRWKICRNNPIYLKTIKNILLVDAQTTCKFLFLVHPHTNLALRGMRRARIQAKQATARRIPPWVATITANLPATEAAMPRIAQHRHWNAAAWYLFIGLLAVFLVRVFLSHWSLLDGSLRNGFGAYLQGQAERPFAYRWLAPWAVQQLSGLLPECLRLFLADDIAPLLYKAFVTPLLERYEPLLPRITARAKADWALQDYRVHYVLMAVLLWLSSVAALTCLGKISRHFGNTRIQTALLALIYTAVYPSVFLHAGYFYDVFEQAFALLAMHYVLQQRWLAFAVVLVVMQCNRETALLLPVFLAPLIRAQILCGPDRARPLAWLAISMAACLAIDLATKSFFAGNAGASFEFHLRQNLAFWRDPDTWVATYDTYATGIALPRLIFLLYFVPLFICSVTGRPGPVTWSACICLAVMSALFIALGYRDEFRAMGICLPFALAALSYRLAGPQPHTPRPCHG